MGAIQLFRTADELAGAIMKREELLRGLAPSYLTPVRLAKIAEFAFRRVPDLRQCSAASLVASVISAAEMGLEPSGALGGGWLVPYRNKKTGQREAQFIPGYRGLVSLAIKCGAARDAYARIVYSKEVEQGRFEHEEGTAPRLVHRPLLSDRGEPVAAYAVFVLPDGATKHEVMPKEEILAIKARSRASSGPWITDELEMWKKTVIKRAAKTLPLAHANLDAEARRLVRALARDDAAEGGEAPIDPDAIDLAEGEGYEHEDEPAPEPEKPASATEKAKEELRKRRGPKAAQAPEAAASNAPAKQEQAAHEPPPPGDADAPPRMREPGEDEDEGPTTEADLFGPRGRR